MKLRCDILQVTGRSQPFHAASRYGWLPLRAVDDAVGAERVTLKVARGAIRRAARASLAVEVTQDSFSANGALAA